MESKRAAITGVKQASVISVELPDPKPGWALVKVMSVPMCTEYKGWKSGRESTGTGHEAAGEVVAVGECCKVKVGDRVVVHPQTPCGECALCFAGDYIHCENSINYKELYDTEYSSATYSNYMLKQDRQLAPIPDGMSYDMAGMALCGLGPSYNAFTDMGVNTFSTVLITGLGPVGMGAIVVAKHMGAKVIVVEDYDWRREFALNVLGADLAFSHEEEDLVKKIKDATGGIGPDYTLDCAGGPAAHRTCIDAVRRMGKCAFVGQSDEDTPVCVSRDLIQKGIHLIGSWHYNMLLYPNMMKMIAESPLVEKLITHTYSLDDIQQAFLTAAEPDRVKIVLHPWE